MSDAQQTSIKVAAVNYAPFIIVENNTVVDGLDYHILKETAKKLKFFYKIDIFPLWNVAREALALGKYDISIGSHWQLSISNSNISGSVTYAQACQTLLVHKPSVLPQETYVFQPFPTYLWGILTIIVFLTSFILTVLHRVFDRKPVSFLTVLLQNWQAITMSGSVTKLFKYHPRNIANVKILWSLHALLICTFYSAGFTSILTSPRYTKNINTIEDWFDSKYAYAHVTGDELELFKQSSDYRVSNVKHNVYLLESLYELPNLVRTKKYVFSTQILSNGYITETNRFDDYGKKHLKVLTECLFVTPFVFMFEKNFALKDSFNEAILQYSEFGFVIKWLKNLERKFMRHFFTKEVEEMQEVHSALKLQRIQGIFYFLLLGNAVAVAVFAIEMCAFIK